MCRFVKPGVNEVEVEAEFAHEFIRGRAGLPTIRSSLREPMRVSCTTWTTTSRAATGAAPAGCRRELCTNYNADLTRTIPVNGRFTCRQRQVYNAVLRVLRSQSAGLVPGRDFANGRRNRRKPWRARCVDLGLLRPKDLKVQVDDPMKSR